MQKNAQGIMEKLGIKLQRYAAIRQRIDIYSQAEPRMRSIVSGQGFRE